jgi:hypothetical protein
MESVIFEIQQAGCFYHKQPAEFLLDLLLVFQLGQTVLFIIMEVFLLDFL